MTLGYLLDEWLAGHQVEETTRASYRLLIDGFLRPALGDTSLSRLCRLGPRPFERLYAELRACHCRCEGREFTEHRTPRPHSRDQRCTAHVCKPLAVSSIRQCHAVLSGAQRREALGPGSPSTPWTPPSARAFQHGNRTRHRHEEAAKNANAAWAQDSDWGHLRLADLHHRCPATGELVALPWQHVDLMSGLLTIRRSLVRRGGKTILKDTKLIRCE